MEEAIRTRLKLISDSVVALMESGKTAILNLKENQISVEEVLVIFSKLKTINERFVSEIYNYFKLVERPSADETSEFTILQMQAEELTAEIKVKCDEHKGTIIQPTECVTSKLPRMELAKFRGDVLKWYQFWDQFSSNVDSRNISDVDKLLYLQSALEGEAKLAVEGLDTTSKNYKIAVDTLKDRYGKQSAIIDAHYVALYRIKTAGKPVKDCRNVFNEIERHLRVLKSLGEDVNHNHLRVMIMEKFPEDLVYELRMKMSSEDETIETIRKHLEHIISARESSNRLKADTISSDMCDNPTFSKTENERFTVESLEVKTERKDDNRLSDGKKYQPHKNERIYRHDNKCYNKTHSFNPRKRYVRGENKVEEPLAKKKRMSCIFCNKDHYNDECTEYKTIQERKVRLRNRCYNCFGEGHRLSDCKMKRKCRHCNKINYHNRALCPTLEPKHHSTKVFNTTIVKCETILQTAITYVTSIDNANQTSKCRLILDCGSQRSYITAKLARALSLPVVEEQCLSVFTFGAKNPIEINSPIVRLKLSTRTERSYVLYFNVVPYITHGIPNPNEVILPELKEIMPMDIILADNGSLNDKVDLLIGNDYYYSFLGSDKIEIREHLFLVKSEFGWIWSGRYSVPNIFKDELSVLTYLQASNEVTKFNEPDLPLQNYNINQLWELETIGITDSPKTTKEEEAIKFFNETIKYIGNRYYVKWPWMEFPPDLHINYGLAYGRLINLVKKLDGVILDEYDKLLKEQVSKGVIEIVEATFASSDNNIVHYLPHHCVIQKNKPTKLRIVYDASSKTKGNLSLNECLYRGPLMLEDLTGLLIRFRFYQIGIVADVEKAFLQIGLQEEDRNVTRFLWLKDHKKGTKSENIQHLRFCRVPFGVISSPFLLNATIRYHLTKTKNVITNRIAEDIYVDNLVTGAQSISEASNIYSNARRSFEELSMNLREWNSNNDKLLDLIPDDLCSKESKTVSVLGLKWDTKKDTLLLKEREKKQVEEDVKTKRGVLKYVASIYDPCGYVVPLLLSAKLFLQDLWKQNIKWDVKFSAELKKKWMFISALLSKVQSVEIPRCYMNEFVKKASNEVEYELHCFTDASKQAYSAVVYIRGCTKKHICVAFVIGKSRVVPIKSQQDLHIPKLELLGVLIGSRLLLYCLKFLRVPFKGQYLWTDSQVVLNWCNSNKLLIPFVARRVTEIKQNKNVCIRYVPTKDNPADVATRTNSTSDDLRIWLSGPSFLKMQKEKWPKAHNQKMCLHTQTFAAGQGPSIPNLPRCETMELDNKEEQKEKHEMEIICSKDYKDQSLTEKEINDIIKLQVENFPKEVADIKTDLARSLKLYKDSNDILRCEGRFRNTNWSDYQKHPILIPKNTEFTTKLIEDIHVRNYHVGVSHTLSLIRMKFWIPQGRNQVQRVIKKCSKCRKYGGGPYKLPPMPPLPPERVNLSLPFAYTGIDYFGPLTIKNDTITKRWVCLFTCLAVRAIHMEVVNDLSAEECLLAIRRFTATRGLPLLYLSDNALQFKLTSDVFANKYCIENDIKWKFIPELAPWFGGTYERLIGLVKHSLKRTIDKHLLNQNHLCTIIKEIEAVVNTRPLTTVGSEIEHVLTPADFLKVGGVLIGDVTYEEFLDSATITKSNLIEGWKRGQAIMQDFTKMFIARYLTDLRSRKSIHKQPRVVCNVIPKIGDVVQIKNDLNRAQWKVGKIIKIVTGSDGHVRVAKVLTSTGETLTRSIGHLYPLELEEMSEREIINEEKETDTQALESRKPTNTKAANQISSESTMECSGEARGDYSVANSRRASLNENESNVQSRGLKRAAAQKAVQRVKEWTSKLMLNLFNH